MIKINRKINHELNQSIIRFYIVVLISGYLYLYSIYLNQTITDLNIIILILFYLISIFEIMFSSVFYNTEYISNHRVAFRIITNVIDNSLLGVAIISFGNGGIPLFIIYLWITFGIGLRYGVRYLMLSTALNIISFLFVVLLSPIWNSNEMLPFSIGLLVSFVVLPCYVYILISKLSNALDSEKKANEIKQNLIANINHELRTPLSSILNITEMLKSNNLDKSFYKSLNMISISTNTLLQLINNILELSKIKSGNAKIENKKFNLNNILFQVKNIIEPQCALKGLKIYFFIDSKCNQYFFGAGNHIKQIITNLGSNASKFTIKGYINISVHVLNDSKYHQELLFEVKDTGVGIDSKNFKKIFKRYSQADKSISKIYGGTGLGISIASELANLMQTEIFVKSEVGKGSSFYFHLKLMKDESGLIENNDRINIYLYKLNQGINNVILDYISYFSNDINIFKVNKLEEIEMGRVGSIVIADSFELESIEKILSSSLCLTDISIIEIIRDNARELKREFVTTQLDINFTRSTLKNAIQICNDLNGSNLFNNSNDHIILNTKPKLLIVEDDQIQLEINKWLFKDEKSCIDIAKNGHEALYNLKNNIYDIVLVDYCLPDMTGLDVVLKYKSYYKKENIKFILITADKNNLENNELINKYFSEIYEKPIPIKLLESFIYKNKIKNIVTENKWLGDDGSLINYNLFDNYYDPMEKNEITKIIELYDKEVFRHMKSLLKIISDDERNGIAEILHKLKGVSATIGAEAFCKLVTDNLQSARENNTYDINLYEDLYSIHVKTINYFREHITNLQS